jgi:hypothetical protein
MIKPQQVNKGFFSTNFTAIKLNSKTMTHRRYLEYYLKPFKHSIQREKSMIQITRGSTG